jgi:hypothetical protein
MEEQQRQTAFFTKTAPPIVLFPSKFKRIAVFRVRQALQFFNGLPSLS